MTLERKLAKGLFFSIDKSAFFPFADCWKAFVKIPLSDRKKKF